MFILLQGSLSQSSSALDNVIFPSSSPVSALGTILWEVSGENLSVKWGSPDTMTISISILRKIWPSPSSIHASLLYSSWMFWPYFRLLNTSFSGLGSVRNSHCSQATLLTHLLIFLWIGMNQSWASRSCLERPANCARALCLGMLPPRGSLCQFPEQAELCFLVEQVGDVAADSRLLGTCILPYYNHCSFHHKTVVFFFLIIFTLSILLFFPDHFYSIHLFCWLVQHIHEWIILTSSGNFWIVCVQPYSSPSMCWVAPQLLSPCLHCSKRFFLAGFRALQWSPLAYSSPLHYPFWKANTFASEVHGMLY